MTSPLQQIEAFLPISFTLATSGQPTPEEFAY
ncbi:MAG TPA: phosphatase, partial [Cyanobacteria bacterium UBA11367]|nr:phosphatase [Cyanobacteria bacterium UBA11367]